MKDIIRLLDRKSISVDSYEMSARQLNTDNLI
nr:MAG TPA: hypothetical protein [Caudoviricetes sp.]